MTRRTLGEHISDHYASQALAPAQLEHLKRIVAEADREHGLVEAARRWHARRWLSAAAAVVLLLVSGVTLERLLADRAGAGDPAALSAAIVREIARNHREGLAIQFPASGYAKLREGMGRLDFALRAPSLPEAAGLHMIGGRYCSIRGQVAAQIKLEDAQGRPSTLYQTRFAEGLEQVVESEHHLEGLRIRLWREGGLFFGLATPES